ncbi:MAG: hypothetical protein R3B54_15375 [Bdellovibrionota bacterium]
MHRRSYFFLLCLLLLSHTTLAISTPRVELVELVDGVAVNEHLHKELTLSSPLILSEEVPVKCIVAPCPPIVLNQRFEIADIQPIGCGSRRVLAFEAQTQAFTDQHVPAQMEILDHTDRYCRDLRPHTFEITVSNEFG